MKHSIYHHSPAPHSVMFINCQRVLIHQAFVPENSMPHANFTVKFLRTWSPFLNLIGILLFLSCVETKPCAIVYGIYRSSVPQGTQSVVFIHFWFAFVLNLSQIKRFLICGRWRFYMNSDEKQSRLVLVVGLK